MQGSIDSHIRRSGPPWNRGKLIGPKPPLKAKDIWSIRVRLQVTHRVRDLALFIGRDVILKPERVEQVFPHHETLAHHGPILPCEASPRNHDPPLITRSFFNEICHERTFLIHRFNFGKSRVQNAPHALSASRFDDTNRARQAGSGRREPRQEGAERVRSSRRRSSCARCR
jgi:hypothetical protein